MASVLTTAAILILALALGVVIGIGLRRLTGTEPRA